MQCFLPKFCDCLPTSRVERLEDRKLQKAGSMNVDGFSQLHPICKVVVAQPCYISF